MEGSADKKVKSRKKAKKKVNMTGLLLAVPAIAAVIAVLVVYMTTNKASKFTLRADAYQTYAGGENELKKGMELKHLEDGTGIVVKGDMQESLADLPVYFKEENTALLPIDMVYYDTRTAIPLKADYFTELSVGDGVRLVRGRLEKDAPLGFVYSGSDLYLFTEPVKLSWNGYETELDALSYVEAVRGEHIMVYDHANNKTYMEDISTDVLAEQLSGDYTIDLLYDSLTLSNGDKVLLFGRADKLPSIFD